MVKLDKPRLLSLLNSFSLLSLLDLHNFFDRLRPARKDAPRAVVAALVLPWMLAMPAGGCVKLAPRPAPTPSRDAIAPEPGAPNAAERRLHALLNEYRIANHRAPVALSRSLSKVARLHAGDLAAHGFTNACSIHSWSQDGPWRPCCYDPGHSDLKCTWNKPRELTPYESIGFEIAYRYSAGVRPVAAMQAWKASPIHNAVMLNLGAWSGRQWRAVGIGIDGEYATVWWGEDTDPAGYWE